MTREGAGDLRVLYLTTRDVEEPRTGADNRAKYLLAGLDGAFPVDVVSFDRTGVATDRGVGTSVPYPPSELLAIVSVRFMLAVVRALREEEHEAVVVSGIGGVIYGVVAALLADAPFVFDDHNVEHELAREASVPRYVVVYLIERLACALATLVVVPTEGVATALEPWTGGEVVVVTNGFDAETFTLEGESASFDGPRLLFFGNFAYEPNVEAVEYIVADLCPRLAARDVDAGVLLAGPGLEPVLDGVRTPENLEALGFVEDLPATIRGADVVVVPLSAGSGSRLKIIESLACGTKVVSTPIGAEGWPDDWENLILADLEEFDGQVIDVLDDATFAPDEYDQVAEYSWQAQSRRLVDALRSTVDAAG